MKSGYDQFFKSAKNNSAKAVPPRPVNMKKLSQNRSKNDKPKKGFPLFQFILFGLCGVGLFSAVENFDHIENYIKKIEIGLGTAQAETTDSVPGAAAVKSEVKTDSVKVADAPVVNKSDDSDYLFKLNERKAELDAREEDLKKKSAEIAKQKEEIESKLKELEQYRAKISSILQERISTDSGKIDTLVQVYTNMKPIQAAKIFETMDEDLVIEILSRMKKKSAADIMNLVKSEKAQVFAERYAGYRMPSSTKKQESMPNP